MEFIHEDDQIEILNHYNEKHRYYHNIDHILNIFKYLDIHSYERWKNIMMVAVWFHDVIYDPTRTDNESKSIAFFIQSSTYKHMDIHDRILVISMIEATKDHIVDDYSPTVLKDFIDADLFELKDPNLPISRTIEIEMSVFKEYGHVPFNIYKKKRIEKLEKLKDTLSLEVDDNINFLKFFKPKIGLYCGSFNPIHKGHYRIIERGAEVFDKIIVARGINPLKTIYTPTDEKGDKEFKSLQRAIPHHETIFYIDFQFDLIKRLQKDYHVVLLKGLRNETDFSYEKKNHLLNEKIGVKNELGVETMFMFSGPEFEPYSSSDIKFLLATSKANIGYNMLHNPPKL